MVLNLVKKRLVNSAFLRNNNDLHGTKILTINKSICISPECIILTGSKPNLPTDLMRNTLPKTPAIELPMIPWEYLLASKPVKGVATKTRNHKVT